MNNQVYTTNKLHNTINIIQDSYITFTFHVSSFNNTSSKEKESSNNTYIHSQAKSTTRQHGNIIINILYKSYKQKGKKSQPQVIMKSADLPQKKLK